MKFLSTALLACSLGFVSVFGQVSVQTFDATVQPGFTFFYGSFSTTNSSSGAEDPVPGLIQNAEFYTIANPAVVNSSASKLEIFFPSSLNLTGNPYLALTAEALSSNTATSFVITLFNSGGQNAYAAFDATLFPTGQFSTSIQPLTVGSGFSFAAVESMIITGNVPGGISVFNFSFANLQAVSAIPEPSTYVLIAMGLGFVGLAIRRRGLRL